MESTISAILGELAARSMSFLVDKYLKHTAAPTEEESVSSLQRLLLRVRVIVEEAEERRITNQAMLQQLSILKEMYRGYYTLDMCICRGAGDEAARDDQVSTSSLPESNPAKRVCVHRDQVSCQSSARQEWGRAPLSNMPVMTRVRAHFSRIVFFTQGDLEGGGIEETLRDGGVVRYQNRMAFDADRVLIIAELGGGRYSERREENIDEGLLGRLYNIRTAPGSKIIVTSRSDKTAGYGSTEPPLKLELLTQEAYWYLLKAYAFGSADVADHPKLASIVMDMSRAGGGCFLAANIFTRLLRSNPSPRFGSLVLAAMKKMKQNHFMYAAADHQESTVCNPRITDCFSILDDYQTHDSAHSSQTSQASRLSVRDVLFGSARPRGIFDALAWKSQIPPYYSYNYSCEIRRPKRNVVRNKRVGG